MLKCTAHVLLRHIWHFSDESVTPTILSNGTKTANETGACVFKQTRTWTAGDECSNTATATKTILWKEDETDPVIHVEEGTTDLVCTAATAGGIYNNQRTRPLYSWHTVRPELLMCFHGCGLIANSVRFVRAPFDFTSLNVDIAREYACVFVCLTLLCR